MKKWKLRVIGLLILLSFLATLLPVMPSPAYGWSDSGLPCAKGTQVTLSNFQPKTLYYVNVWNVQISGAVSGSGKTVYLNSKSNGGGNGYNFVSSSNYTTAARELNGEPSFVLSKVSSIESTISWGSGSQKRAYIRDFAKLCGAEVKGFDQGFVYVMTTSYPRAQINPPTTIKAGEQVKISISGTSFVPSGSPYTSISYNFYVNSNRVDSGSGSKTFSKQVSHTFSTAGTYTLTLEVTDGVGRTTTETKTVNVQEAAQPPTPPPGGNIPPVADFEMPSSAEVNESVTVTDRSKDYDGTIVQRTWSVSPSSYSGTLSGTGGTIRFTQTGTYAVKLTVRDNKGATGECTKYITVGEALPPPPPPEPPEPVNEPPVARFTMPSECGPGQTVNVINRSYDPDGSIVEVEWDVTPSRGVEENLGDDGGTLVFNELGTYTVKLTVTDDRGDSDSTEKEIEVVNQPPTAKIVVPDKIIQGEDVTVRSASRDSDGEIVKLIWSVTPAENVVGELEGEESIIYFDKEGQYKITLTVEDSWGATDTDEVTVTVEPAIPQAFFTDEGAYKQNRRIVLIEEGQSSKRYPIIKEQNEWHILPVGNGATAEAIKIKDVAPDKKEVLFKEPGTYKVRLRVTNTAGHASEWYEREFEIVPDEPPVADFVVQEAYLRDPSAGKKATVEIRDTSYSPDGDIIARRIWKYRYDSNNDGNFEGEQWVVFSDGNEMSPSFQTDQVGKYQIELEVVEGFGEETIQDFISPEDYLKADTSAKPLEEKKAEVINIRPSVGFDVQRKKKADIIFTVGQTTLSPTVTWINQYLDRAQFSQVIEAESTSATKSGTWYLSPDRTVVWMSSGSIKVTFSKPGRAVYIQLNNCDHNDGYVEVYVDGVFYGKQDTRNQGHFACEITNLSNTAHTVEIKTGGNGELHIDYFATKDVPQPTFDANIVQYLDGLINQYLKPELAANLVDYKISSVQTSTITTQTDFPWAVYNLYGTGLGTGDGQFHVEGNSYRYRGYGAEAPIDHLYYDDGILGAKREFTFNIDMTGYNACATIIPGFIFGANDKNGFKGYIALMWHNAVGVYYFSGSDHTVLTRNGAGEVARTRNPSSFGGTQVAYFSTRDTSLKKSFRMVYKAPTLEVYDGGELLATVDCPQAAGNGYGVAAANSSHNCGARSYIRFENFKLETSTGKTLDEVLKDSSLWRDDAAHFLVNISAVAYPEFNDPVKSSYIYSRLLNDRIDFCVLGSSANQTQALSIIAKNDGQGTFILNSNRNTAMQQLTSYILSRLNSLYPPVENYVLLNEEVYYKTYYNDPENDPKYAEQWKYSHDPEYFENSLGLAPFHEQWLPAPVCRFDKVGEFVTTFQARDNPKDDDRFDEYRLWSYMPVESLHLYVHRRPVVMFGVQLTRNGDYYNVKITSDAYDLDHISLPNKGLVEHRWSWRPVNSTTWNDGKPTTLVRDNDYLIKYEVKDLEGAWSYPVVKLVSTRNVNLPPVAQFTITPNPAVANKSITVTDLSYDPNGDPIIQRQWRVRNPSGTWSSASSSPPTSFSSQGEWLVELKVYDGSLWSEPFYQTVQVIPDNNAPMARFTVTPNPVYDVEPVTYTDTSYDPDGDPIVARQWRIRKDSGSWQYYTNPPTVFADVGGPGVYDIELRVQDQPRLPQLEPKWSDWYRQTLVVKESFEVAVISIQPSPAERGRNILIKAAANSLANGQRIAIDRMKVILPLAQKADGSPALPSGASSHEAWMTYNPGDKTYSYTYRIPELTVKGRWPDDGTYVLKVIGYKDTVSKEDTATFRVKGHVLRRVYIKTESW
ncbi:PKD domain-containing protein [Moorellaceae bacterium AZ2]